MSATQIETIVEFKSNSFAWRLTKKHCCQSIFIGKDTREWIDIEQINGFLFYKMGITYNKDKPRYKRMVFDGEHQQLSSFQKLYNGNCFETHYNLPLHGWGRVHANQSCSIGLFHRPTRHGLSEGRYLDIDMVCCQPNILCAIARLNNIQIPQWEEYVKDPKRLRLAIARFHNVSTECAKSLLLRICFGGSYESWIVEEKIECKFISQIVEMEKQIIRVIDLVFDHNQQIAKDVKKALGEIAYHQKYPTDTDKKRNVMGLWCQTVERLCQEAAISWLVVEKKFQVEDVVPCQDGFMILPHLSYDGILDDCKNAAVAKFGFGVDFIFKPFNEAIEIPRCRSQLFDTICRAVESEEQVAELLMFRFRNNLKICNGQMFFKRSNVWERSESAIKSFLLNFIQSCNFYNKTKAGNKPFSSRTNVAKNILESLMWKANVFLLDNDLYDKFRTTTVGRLCFQDGVLDFIAKRFYTWEDLESENIEFYSTVMIPRDFKKVFDDKESAFWQTQINDVLTQAVQPLFLENTQHGIQVFARGIAGCYRDKAWTKFTGNRNCGKGSFGGLLKNAIADYYYCVQGLNFVQQKSAQGEAARSTMWMLPAQFSRIAVVQEFPKFGRDTKIDGIAIKGWCSGGDEQTTRQLFHNDPTKFKLQSLLAFFANNFPEIEPADALETCHSFHSIKTYVSQADYDAEQA